MTTNTLSFESAVNVLESIVAEFGPETTYSARIKEATGSAWHEGDSCYYRVDDKPMCIVGVAFDRLGVPYNEKWEDHTAWSIFDDMREEGWVIEQDAYNLLMAAQSAQDDGETWGEALAGAKQYVERHHTPY